MPDPKAQPAASASNQQPPIEYCATYRVPMLRTREHVGEGNEAWSEPLCPRIHQLGGEGCVCKGEVKDAALSGQERQALAEQAKPAAIKNP